MRSVDASPIQKNSIRILEADMHPATIPIAERHYQRTRTVTCAKLEMAAFPQVSRQRGSLPYH